MSSTLLLLPGLLCDDAVWASQMQSFSGRLQCVVPNYGLRDSIVAMAEHVLATAPTPTFALAGHSMGGRVALQVIRMAPQRVERLALLDTSALPLPGGEAGENEREIRMVLLELAQVRGMRTMGAQWLRSMVHKDAKHGPVFDAILDMLDRSSPAQYAAQVKALLSRPDSTPVLPTIACPTLVLCGRDDHVSTPEQHQAMAEAIPGATVTVLEHCGHMAPMEKPEQVNAAMLEWLAR